jgi:hypothetical protein
VGQLALYPRRLTKEEKVLRGYTKKYICSDGLTWNSYQFANSHETMIENRRKKEKVAT